MSLDCKVDISDVKEMEQVDMEYTVRGIFIHCSSYLPLARFYKLPCSPRSKKTPTGAAFHCLEGGAEAENHTVNKRRSARRVDDRFAGRIHNSLKIVGGLSSPTKHQGLYNLPFP